MKITRHQVVIRVHLHRIPEKHINIFVDKKFVKVDTLTWKKKQLQLRCALENIRCTVKQRADIACVWCKQPAYS